VEELGSRRAVSAADDDNDHSLPGNPNLPSQPVDATGHMHDALGFLERGPEALLDALE
jgi:hypothetical protein